MPSLPKVPSGQSAHWRLVVGVQDVVSCCPKSHVSHDQQLPPVPQVPVGQSPHTRSALPVQGEVWVWPSPQTVQVWQALPSGLKLPLGHAEQTRSLSA